MAKIIEGNLEVTGSIKVNTGIYDMNDNKFGIIQINLNNYLSDADRRSILLGDYGTGKSYVFLNAINIEFNTYQVVEITITGEYSGNYLSKTICLENKSQSQNGRMYVGVTYTNRGMTRQVQTTYSLRTNSYSNSFMYIDIGENPDNLNLVCTDLLLTSSGYHNHLMIKNILNSMDLANLVIHINSEISALETSVGGVSYGRISTYSASELNTVLTAIRTQTNNATAKALFGKIAVYLFKDTSKVAGYIDHTDSGAVAISDITVDTNGVLYAANYLTTTTIEGNAVYVRAQTIVDAAACSFNSIVIKE